MKFIDYHKREDKEAVYDLYTRIVFEPKDYHKITRKQMLNSIVDVYREREGWLRHICTIKELKFLKYLSSLDVDELVNSSLREINEIYEKNKHHNKKRNDEFDKLIRNTRNVWPSAKLVKEYWWEIRELVSKGILGFDIETHMYYVFEEFEDVVKSTLDNIDFENPGSDDFVSFAIGLLKVFGSIDFKIYKSMLHDITQFREDVIESFVKGSPLFNFYTGFTYNQYFDSNDDDDELNLMVFYRNYDYLLDYLDDARMEQGNIHRIDFEPQSIMELFLDGFPINKKPVKDMVDYTLSHFGDDVLLIFENIDLFRLLNEDDDYISTILELHLHYDSKDTIKQYLKMVRLALNEMPSGALNGSTPNNAVSYIEEYASIRQSFMKDYKKQVSARLSHSDAELFYKLYFGLLSYTDEKLNVVSNYNYFDEQTFFTDAMQKIADKFWDNCEAIINQFCLENPYDFSKEELDIVRGFIRSINDTFVLAKFEKNHTIFLKNNTAYMVKGLFDNIDEIYDVDNIPGFVTTRLLPFKSNIITDGRIYSYTVSGGADLIESLSKELEEAERVYVI